MRRYNHRQLFSAVRPSQYDEERSATAQRQFSNGGQNLGGVVSEAVSHPLQALDVYRQGYQFCLGIALQKA